jgi:prepilin-type N-terminal cleavage/methylation domain-containing protein
MRCILGEEAASSNIAYAGNLLAAFALVPQNPGKVFDTIYRYGFIVPLMKRISVPARCTQHGFTLVEVVAVMVITVTLAAWAMPKMDRAGDIGTGSAANRLVAALQYAQVLAQRQGVPTRVEIINSSVPWKVEVKWSADGGATFNGFIKLPADENYTFELDRDVSITNCTSIVYKTNNTLTVDGVPMPAAGKTCLVNNGEIGFTIKIEPTGHAYLVT